MKEVGKRTTPELIEAMLDKVKPDYAQCDAKGHPGYTSYKAEHGIQAPGVFGDSASGHL